MLFALLAGSLPRGTRTWLHFLARRVDQGGKVPTNQSVNQPLRAQKHRLRWKLLTTLCPMLLRSHKSFVPMEQQTANNHHQQQQQQQQHDFAFPQRPQRSMFAMRQHVGKLQCSLRGQRASELF